MAPAVHPSATPENATGFWKRERKTHIGDRVRFSVASIFLPDPEAAVLSPTSEMEGVIVDFSDSGNARRAFAVVEVVRTETVVVPVNKLRLQSEGFPSGKDLA
jgi:hypothetical protein